MSFGASLADHSHGMKFLDKLLEKGTSSITSCFFRKSTHIKLLLETIQDEKLAYDFESFIHCIRRRTINLLVHQFQQLSSLCNATKNINDSTLRVDKQEVYSTNQFFMIIL